jgi:hypothetical protein
MFFLSFFLLCRFSVHKTKIQLLMTWHGNSVKFCSYIWKNLTLNLSLHTKFFSEKNNHNKKLHMQNICDSLKICSQVQQTNSSANCILLYYKLSLSKYNIHIMFVALDVCTVGKYSVRGEPWTHKLLLIGN